MTFLLMVYAVFSLYNHPMHGAIVVEKRIVIEFIRRRKSQGFLRVKKGEPIICGLGEGFNQLRY